LPSGVSVLFPYRDNPENNRVLELNKQMLKENTEGPYELIMVVGGDQHIVYPAFNFLIKQAKYPTVVMANTDVLFAPGWDSLLHRYIDTADWFSFRLIECGAIGSDQIVKDFGQTAASFDRQAFYDFVDQEKPKYPEITDGFVWYVPCAWKKEYFLSMGGFNEEQPFPYPNDIDFRKKCEEEGARFKVLNSWAYHLQRARENSGDKQERE